MSSLSMMRLCCLSLSMMTMGATVTSAQTAYQAVPAEYQSGQYCQGLTPYVPKGTPESKRILVEDVSCLQQQLQPYFATTLPANTRYQAHKAEAWLSYVNHENSEGSLTPAGQYALSEAMSILWALKTDQADKLPMNADIPPTSGLKRPDLWAVVLSAKQNDMFTNYVKQVAHGEVKLIWAEAEYCEFGWRHSREHFSAAERWLDSVELTSLSSDVAEHFLMGKDHYNKQLQQLDAQSKACQGALLSLLTPPIEPVIPTMIESSTYQEQELALLAPAIVHFALDKSYLDERSKAVIDDLLSRIGQHHAVNDITFHLHGFTDVRASNEYNIALSQRRINSVANYLSEQGISISQIKEYPKGESLLKRQETDVISHALNRRVEIYVSKDGENIIDQNQAAEVLNQNNYPDLKLEK